MAQKLLGYNKTPEQERDEMHIVRVRYGFHRVVTEHIEDNVCEECLEKIHGQMLKIEGKMYHHNCWPRCKNCGSKMYGGICSNCS